MTISDRDIALAAFATPEWRAAADSLFQATGVTVTVMDLQTCDTLYGSVRCGYCHLATDVDNPGPLACYDNPPRGDSGTSRVICRAGLPTLIAPVMQGDHAVAHVVIGGFVTSTRERRKLYEKLLGRGVREDSARLAVKAVPVLARRQAEAFLDIAVSAARTVLDSAAERMLAKERVEELRLFVTAGEQVVATERLDAPALSAIAEEAVALVNGEAGAVLRAHGTHLEVIAHTEHWRGRIGAQVEKSGSAAGRAVDTGRMVMAPGGSASESSRLALPLIVGGRTLGVLEVRLPSSMLPLPPNRLSRLDRFGRFMAIALERDDERAQVDRAMSGYAQLNELAAALGAQTDIDGVAHLVTSVIDKSFSFDIAGLVLTSWGKDRADIVLGRDASTEEVDSVLADVAGRDLSRHPFQTRRFVTYKAVVDDSIRRNEDDWAISSVELRFGDLEVGYLFVARGDGERYHAQDRALLDGIAAHAAAAFGRAALFARIRDDYAKTIAALSATLDAGERSVAGHAGRVMEYAMAIGEELNLPVEQVEQLRFAGLLHDVGKTGIPAEILIKPSKLTAEEMERVKQHAEMGASIVDQIDFLKSLTPVILHHHERWDGKGYPVGLAAEEIPFLARVLAVADSYDAMTSERSYRPKMTTSAARRELEAGAGTQYDPRVVAALLEVLDKQRLAGATGLLAPKSSRPRADLPA